MARRKPDLDDEDDLDTPPARGRGRAPLLDDEDDDAPKSKKATANAYTGLAFLATLGLIGAAVMFYLDASELGTPPPPAPATFTLLPLGGNVTAAAPAPAQ